MVGLGFMLLGFGLILLVLSLGGRLLVGAQDVPPDDDPRPKGYPGALIWSESARQYKRLIVVGSASCVAGILLIILM